MDDEAIDVAAGLYPALARTARDLGLDAITVRCFDLLRDLRTSSCLAIAQLNDDGMVAGCEGDLVSAVAMMWVRRLLPDAVPWMANPADVDAPAGRVLLAHCTIARSMVQAYALRTHFESGIGVGIAGVVPPGDATLLRIGGAEMDRLWVAEGRILPHTPLEDVCRTQMEVELEDPGAAAELLDRPLGNHVVAVFGRHADRLRSWWRLMVSPA